MFNTKEIEKKWQNYWKENKLWEASNSSDKEKYYLLVEFPYPSGSGLHVGHVRSYTALDAMARLKSTIPNGMGCFWSTCRTICN